jgi:hypothetical protein
LKHFFIMDMNCGETWRIQTLVESDSILLNLICLWRVFGRLNSRRRKNNKERPRLNVKLLPSHSFIYVEFSLFDVSCFFFSGWAL